MEVFINPTPLFRDHKVISVYKHSGTLWLPDKYIPRVKPTVTCHVNYLIPPLLANVLSHYVYRLITTNQPNFPLILVNLIQPF